MLPFNDVRALTGVVFNRIYENVTLWKAVKIMGSRFSYAARPPPLGIAWPLERF